MYFVYIAILFFVFLFIYSIFRRDLFIPPVMMTFCFLMCSIMVLARYNDWAVSSFSIDSCFLLLLGVITYIIGSSLSYFWGSHFAFNYKIGKSLQSNIRRRIDISLMQMILACLVGFVELLLFTKYVQNTVLVMKYNHSTFAKMLFSYRWLLMRNLIPTELTMPVHLSFLKYTVEMISAFAIYVYIHNKSMKCFEKKDRLLILLILFWPLNALLTSSRGDIITMLAGIIYLIYFFYGINNGFSVSNSIKMLGKSTKILIIFIILFFLFAVYQNRINADNTLWNSITIYISGGVRAFDIYVKEPLKRNTGLLGNDETLRYFSTFFAVHRGQGQKPLLPLEFRYINGKSIGNIFTAFRRYYSDFGIIGIIIFSSVLGFIMTQLYVKSRNTCIKEKNGFSILLFAWLSKSIFYMAIEDCFYVTNVSLNGLYKIIILYILYLIFVEKRKFLRFRR